MQTHSIFEGCHTHTHRYIYIYIYTYINIFTYILYIYIYIFNYIHTYVKHIHAYTLLYPVSQWRSTRLTTHHALRSQWLRAAGGVGPFQRHGKKLLRQRRKLHCLGWGPGAGEIRGIPEDNHGNIHRKRIIWGISVKNLRIFPWLSMIICHGKMIRYNLGQNHIGKSMGGWGWKYTDIITLDSLKDSQKKHWRFPKELMDFPVGKHMIFSKPK